MNPENSDTSGNSISRRNFLALSAAAPAVLLAPSAFAQSADSNPSTAMPKKYPIGLELYSVRDELSRDLPNTLKQVAGMGYEIVEFYAPYFDWKIPYAKDVRTQLDDLGLKCYSTHNHIGAFTPGDGLNKAIELNQILGSKIIVMASSPAHDLDSWKKVCEQLSAASDSLQPHGLRAGFHNHQTEWAPLDGNLRTMDIIAAHTPKDFVLQLDVGTCVEAGADPVAWINANPGRIRVLHLKDWARDGDADRKGYHALFGEGVCPWKEIFTAAETTGGVEYYLLEQEGSRFPEFETARRCLDNWKTMRQA